MLTRLLLLAALSLWPGYAPAQWIGPPNLTLCNKVATFSGVNAATSLVAAVPRTKVLVCGYQLTNTAGTGTVTFNTGTQTTNPCDTNTVTMTPAISVGTNAVVDHQQYASQDTAVGSGVCVTPSVVTITGILYYTTVSTSQ